MRFPILMSGVLAACAGAPQHVSEYDVKSPLARDLAPSDADVPQLARDNATFAVRLYQAAAAEPGNLLMSPHSISTALAMTFAGARGQTASEK